MLGANAQGHGSAAPRVELCGLGRRHRQGAPVAEPEEQAVALPFQPAGHEVHLRRAQEAGDEPGGRALEQVEGSALLLDHAVIEQDDPVGQGHGLDLVVGDVDRGLADLAVQPLDLGPHPVAQLGVEVGERLVEQEQARVAHDRPADGDPLPLAAR